ncbi:MAG: protein translocase subunit SecF [Nocardioidaceae bacterium]|nr:protein translocase subunit SecF [Nocardioidaceae bacterium]
MGRFSRLGTELYDGRRSIDFVGRKWTWYTISGVLIVVALLGLFVKGLNLGIEFKGGVEYSVSLPKSEITQGNADKIRDAVAGTGIQAADAPVVNTSGETIKVTTKTMSNDDADKVSAAIADEMNVPESKISTSEVGASWGHEVANRAVKGLIIFLILVVLLIWGYFREWKMSVAGIVALAHDILITVGVYALSGFEVTPATVTGFLTILGFSLYDTVVVFDKIRENTKNLRQSRRTYAQLANLAVNQTLVRSINTSVVALLPVGALLYVGVVNLGDGPLKDLALALFVGMAVGAYSSIFIATPLLVQLKAREKEVTEQERRAKARQKRDIDRYANVPVFSEGMPVSEEPSGFGGTAVLTAEDDDEPETPQRAERRPEATGSGRTAPAQKAPVEQSGSAKRNQPSRQPRSKRTK